MPTILSHPAVSLALVPWLRRCPPSLFVLAAICSALPDVDVLAFSLGIPYVHPLGHRGVTHSLGFAVLAAALAGLLYVRLVRSAVSFRVAFALLAGSFISHGVLDAMTSGGEGVGFLIPFSSERFFFPWRPIRVSPIGIGFFSKAGVVLGSEVRYVWAPAAAVGVIGLLRRSAARARGEKPGHHE